MVARSWAGALALLLAVGCVPRVTGSAATGAHGKPLSPAAAEEEFEDALAAFAQHDAATSWTAEACKGVAASFERLGERGPEEQRGEAFYNAGQALKRCGLHEAARRDFAAAVRVDPEGMHRAAAELVLADYAASGDRDAAIAGLERVIRAAQFQNAEALVAVAALQVERGVAQGAAGSPDLEAAQHNLQRALAIDDGYMPAMNQLALLQLARARVAAGVAASSRDLVLAGVEQPELSRQQLDLAALIASQGLEKNPEYAPLHNTAGLVQVELRDYNGAIRSFKRARALDARFFEAHMNYGSVSLGIRGFAEAERAYRDALALDPESYEAHLGLALALRGQLEPGGDPARLAEAERHLDRARALAPERPEAYYNAAILAQELRAKSGGGAEATAGLEAAYCLYGDFVERAPAASAAVRRATERREDIVATLGFMANGADRTVTCP